MPGNAKFLKPVFGNAFFGAPRKPNDSGAFEDSGKYTRKVTLQFDNVTLLNIKQA